MDTIELTLLKAMCIEQDTNEVFNPLAMVDMWEEMHVLVNRWEHEYNANSGVAAEALQEFASALKGRPTDREGITWSKSN